MIRFRRIVSLFVWVLVFLCAPGYSGSEPSRIIELRREYNKSAENCRKIVESRRTYLRDWLWVMTRHGKKNYYLSLGLWRKCLHNQEAIKRHFLPDPLTKVVSQVVSKLGELAKGGDLAGFRKLCVARARKTEELYRRLRRERLYWAQAIALFARNVKDPNLVAVYLLYDYRNDDNIFPSPDARRRYLAAAQVDEDYLMKNIRFGFRETIYLRRQGRTWLVDPDVSDPKLEKILNIGIFYPAIRERIWNSASLQKDGLKLDDESFWKRRDYAKYFIANAHFTVDEAYRLETEAIEAKREEAKKWDLRKKIKKMSKDEARLMSFLERLRTDCWKKRYTEAELKRLLAMAEELNDKMIYIMKFLGQQRLFMYCAKYNVRLFRKPVLIPLIENRDELAKMNPEVYRHDVLRLLQIDLSRTYHSVNADSYKCWVDCGLNAFQLQGYQKIRFDEKDYYLFFGIVTASRNIAQCQPDLIKASLFLRGNDRWISLNHLDDDDPLRVIKLILASLYHSGFRYDTLLNVWFGDRHVGETNFEHFKFTAAEFNARLMRERLYSLLRIREAKECIEYKPGMMLEEIPYFSVQEILDILKEEKKKPKRSKPGGSL